MADTTAGPIDDVGFWQALAAEMNAHPERYRRYGEADMNAAIVMRRANGADAFRVGLTFDALICEEVRALAASEVAGADYVLDGDLADWQGMFDDIAAHGRAERLWTINSLALLGDRITCDGDDPMGLDKFSRFNQTLQEFLDGAARLTAAAIS